MKEALSIISRADSFLLLPHHLPDVDAIGSAVALAMALAQKGKKAKVFSPSTLSAPVSSLLDSLNFKIANKCDFNAFDCIVVLDTNSPMLFDYGPVKEAKALKLLIDHHSPKEEVVSEFDAAILDESAVSTSQIIYRLLNEMDAKITPEIATAVSAGIVTDSANFVAATPDSFAVIAEALTKTGVSFQDVLKSFSVPIETSERIARIKAAQRSELFREGDCLIAVSRVGSFEGSVARSFLALGADVSFVGVAKEGEIRISARARNHLVEKGFHLGRDVMPLVAELINGDGGGHAAAAGANGTEPDQLEPSLKLCVEKARDFIKTI